MMLSRDEDAPSEAASNAVSPSSRVAAESSACGFILAGGRSSRMGTDKALVHFHGRPLIQIALATLQAAGLEGRIAGQRSQLPVQAEAIPDHITEAGPLGGIHAALLASSARWNLFLPVDMPLMPSLLLARLLQRAALTAAPVTAVRLNGRLEPFPVLLDRAVLPGLTEQLMDGQRICRVAWQALPQALGGRLDAPEIETLHTLGLCRHGHDLPPVYWFQSANTAADLELLHRLSPPARAAQVL